jgi:hypothetical protein
VIAGLALGLRGGRGPRGPLSLFLLGEIFRLEDEDPAGRDQSVAGSGVPCKTADDVENDGPALQICADASVRPLLVVTDTRAMM